MATFSGYCEKEQVRARLKKITQSVRGGADIEEAIERADSVIDGTLYGTFVIPFSYAPDAPKLIEKISLALACAYVLQEVYEEEEEEEAKLANRLEKWGEKQLEKIQKGELKVKGATAVTKTASIAVTREAIVSTDNDWEDEKQSKFHIDKI